VQKKTIIPKHTLIKYNNYFAKTIIADKKTTAMFCLADYQAQKESARKQGRGVPLIVEADRGVPQKRGTPLG